jgi:2-haloacid dehalogenase
VERWATFDCYGTLIDWDGGISRELLAGYHELEPQVQAESPDLAYRDVMTEAVRRLGSSDPERLARSLPSWEPFPEVPASLEELRGRGWRLAILSNTDTDLLTASQERLGVPFDAAVVASEIGSYKPAHGHWHRFFEQTGADRQRHVHVAGSHFHDIVPAAALGLTSVWVNRLGERRTPAPTRELPDLTRLPETLDELVPV